MINFVSIWTPGALAVISLTQQPLPDHTTHSINIKYRLQCQSCNQFDNYKIVWLTPLSLLNCGKLSVSAKVMMVKTQQHFKSLILSLYELYKKVLKCWLEKCGRLCQMYFNNNWWCITVDAKNKNIF